MGAEDKRADQVYVPVERDEIDFYGHILVAVRLSDGRICAVLRWLCEGLNLQANAQLERIKRKAALTDGLVYVRMETPGGPQSMPALTLDVLPGWLFGIDETRVKPEARQDVILFQRECVKVLAEHFANKRNRLLPSPTAVVLAEPLQEPTAPGPDASWNERRTYYRDMLAWIDWKEEVDRFRQENIARQQALEERQAILESRQDAMESRMEGVEELARMGSGELSRLYSDINERLGPLTLTPEHQSTAKHMAARLHEVSGIAFPTIYGDLNDSFHVGKYSDIPDDRWAEVTAWFKTRIDAAARRKRQLDH